MKKLTIIITSILFVLLIGSIPYYPVSAQSCSSTVDVDLVVDVSGSISRESLDSFKQAMGEFVTNTGDDDRIAVQQFSSDAQRIIPLSSDKQDVLSAINSISRLGGGTNFQVSLENSLKLFQENNREAVHVIVFLSDGRDLVWNQTQGTLDVVSQSGIIIHTVSVGLSGEFNKNILEEMASRTGGAHWNAPEESALQDLYRSIAQEVCVTEENTLQIQEPNTEPDGSSNETSESKPEPDAPICSDTPPNGAPDLFQIDRNGDNATLFFTPLGDPNTYYYISYGLDESAEGHGVEIPGDKDGVISYTINGLDQNKTYYFKVRGGNGCKPGDWSNSSSGTIIPGGMPSTGKLK